MLKIEYIWRELLYQAIEKNNPDFQISDLSHRFSLSTSVVSHALVPLRNLSIVEIGKLGSKVTDSEKLLYFWATRRNLKKDIVYSTHTSLPIMDIESSMPSNSFPTAYSAIRLYLNESPADYDKTYFYSENSEEIQKRFPHSNNNNHNLFILKPDPYFSIYSKTTLAQIFTDLWNLSDWFAKEYSNLLLNRIKSSIGL